METRKYLEIRRLVLIGLEQYGWSAQQVLSNNSEAFLDFILPKTKAKAALNLATKIACLDHDKNIHGNKIHLFRLPLSIEARMNQESTDLVKVDAISRLAEISSGIAVETSPGAINIGSIHELQSDDIIQAFAKHYLEAFKGGYKTYPYLR
jgi:hypothetical protein